MSILSELYTEEQFKTLCSGLDDATTADLYSYFKTRTPIDEFEQAINQTVLRYGRRYTLLLRDESVKYDAMITDYIERLTQKAAQTNTTEDGTTATNSTSEKTHKNDNSRTDTLNKNGWTTTTHTGTDKTDTEGTAGGSTEHTGTTTTDSNTALNSSTNTDSRGMDRTNPMTNSYTVSQGTLPLMTWDAPDTQAQNSEQKTQTDNTNSTSTTTNNLKDASTTTSNETGTTTYDTTQATHDTGTDTTTTTETGTATDSDSSKITSSDSKTGSTIYGDRGTERYTGRHGYSPAELLEKSRQYILGTDSFSWLCEKFNKCFIWTIEL